MNFRERCTSKLSKALESIFLPDRPKAARLSPRLPRFLDVPGAYCCVPSALNTGTKALKGTDDFAVQMAPNVSFNGSSTVPEATRVCRRSTLLGPQSKLGSA